MKICSKNSKESCHQLNIKNGVRLYYNSPLIFDD